MVKDKDYRNPLLQIRISPELEKRLDTVAEMYGVTKQEVARMAIGQYVGQITGSIDRMVEKMADKAEAQFDMSKLIELMMPKLMEMGSNEK